jgi:uncharacterized membrane protein HdeD (DUF308 family)
MTANQASGASTDPSMDRSSLDVLRGSRLLAYSIGAVTLIAGLVRLFWPHSTLTVVARLAGALILAVGVVDLTETFRNHRTGSYRGLLALRGVLNVGFGLLLVFWPHITVTALVWIFGLDLVLTGLLGLLVFRQLPEDYRRPMLNRAIVTIVFGLLIMIWPSVTLSVVGYLVAALLIVFGLILLWSGYVLNQASRAAV